MNITWPRLKVKSLAEMGQPRLKPPLRIEKTGQTVQHLWFEDDPAWIWVAFYVDGDLTAYSVMKAARARELAFDLLNMERQAAEAGEPVERDA